MGSPIFDSTGTISIDPEDYDLIDPDSIRKAMVDLGSRPWKSPMPAAERWGRTGAVTCSGAFGGSYSSEQWRALERSTTSETGWSYRYFNEKPRLGSACRSKAEVERVVVGQSKQNRRRAEQWVALTSRIAQLWTLAQRAASGAGPSALGSSSSTLDASARAPRQTPPGSVRRPGAKVTRAQGRTVLGQRWARRLESSETLQGIKDKLRERLAADAGVPVEAVVEAVDEAVEAAAVAQVAAIDAAGGLPVVSAELREILNTAYPIPSPERIAELWPLVPVEIQNVCYQNAAIFAAAGLE